MRAYMLYAILAGVAWGVGGYFEKVGLQQMRMPPILGITVRTLVALVILGAASFPVWRSVSWHTETRYWVMIIVGGGLIAGSLGMWSFYSALARSENLGITLATAFALSPVAGTLVGLVRRDQEMDLRIAVGMAAVIIGLVILQTAQKHHS